MKFSKNDYIDKINNASPLQLIVITFELAIVNIKASFDTDDRNDFETHIKKSQDFLMQLMYSLDMSFPISKNLLNIYLYVNKLLCDSFFSMDKNKLVESLDLLESLLKSFENISKQDLESTSILDNSNEIYLGLTYTNQKLNEFVYEDVGSGYLA